MRRFFLVGVVASIMLTVGCSSKSIVKHSDHGVIYSEAMGRDMAYSVYTPPGWTKNESLPLLVLLHGAKDSHETFDRYQVGQYLDDLMESGDLPRAVIVNPDGELGFWENWIDGSRSYRDWVVKDLMPIIQSDYATLPCPEYCYVSGMSMGAHGAIRFAYYEPGLFSSVAAISGRIFTKTQEPPKSSFRNMLIKWLLPTERIWGDIDGENSVLPDDIDPYISWVEKPELQEVRLFLAWGDKDYKGIIESNERFQAHLSKHQREHSWMVYQGKHLWVDWRNVIAESLRFHIKGKASAANVIAYKDHNLPTKDGLLTDK